MAMNCADARDLLIDRLMDEPDPEEERRLETHLAGCSACRAAAGQMAEAWEPMEALGVSTPPPPDPVALIRFGRRIERPRARLAGPLQA
ncbi:MAG: anti-sigma factor family protein, partial [Gemmatimonadota bacterium]